MLTNEIPKHYTTSPSSFSGTPHITINRDITADLDSSNAFEGPEKLLEVWFCPSQHSLLGSAMPAGLKVVPPEVWKDMLDLVSCKVLSVVESDHVDAYLLSESSMFVFPHKLILKTCGTTTLLCGLPRILEIAALIAGFPYCAANLLRGTGVAAMPYRVFYSRKNFLFPDRQRGPHRSWRDEVKSLDRLFLGGSAYMIGKMNGEHWYLYLTEPNTILTPPATPDRTETSTKILDLPVTRSKLKFCYMDEEDEQDETLEILMTDLNKESAKQFYLDEASAIAEGQYFQKAYEARMEAQSRLGSINHDVRIDFKTNEDDCLSKNCKYDNDGIDIFSNTSSENSEFTPKDEVSFPEELTTEGHALGTIVSETSGLANVYPPSKYPDARIDAYLFTPCGFSANGVIPSPSTRAASHYFTVHVTPEPHCSFASFETNVPLQQTGRDTTNLVQQVVDIFKPGRFSVTLFEAKIMADENNVDFDGKLEERVVQLQAGKKYMRMENIRGYKRIDRIVHDLDGYELVFKYYERFDWEGGAPRLGEEVF